jgi:hypothetical protein
MRAVNLSFDKEVPVDIARTGIIQHAELRSLPRLGATINLFDPDGNRIGIRDEAGFRQQLGE